ncbi:unnamed protein product [Arabis nemorensis]|uniref:Uncharacterized protein n=1 Tax=Arabis nemorensis TaxID=586526 RepID=A0A565BTY1_9BRAS|nr:unnamed protein product [Arabis nemorensis]
MLSRRGGRGGAGVISGGGDRHRGRSFGWQPRGLAELEGPIWAACERVRWLIEGGGAGGLMKILGRAATRTGAAAAGALASSAKVARCRACQL